jgi:hypothetical protein
MNSFGLVVRDDQTFLSKVVNLGMEQGTFTRDRADEIIRISVAMANKYVLDKEIDFRSEDELAKVQETILQLIGIGLHIKSQGNIEEGVNLLMETSPVALFRLAYTRIEKLRTRWRQLLLNHRIEILVSPEEFECLTDITCQRLAELSIFNETELYTIRSTTLGDELFSTLETLEYYEAELARYEFILKLKDILPFKLLNRSPHVRAENLAEIDSIREALCNTLVISSYLNARDPVSLTMQEVRDFLERLEEMDVSDMLPEELEDAVLDVIQELGEGLEEKEVSLLTREILRSFEKLLDAITSEWDPANPPSETFLFKRWGRMVILSDAPDQLERILSASGALDEFDFEVLVSELLTRPDSEASAILDRIPWEKVSPQQVVRLFHESERLQILCAPKIQFGSFTPADLIELLEGLDPRVIALMQPALAQALPTMQFSLDELASVVEILQANDMGLLKAINPPEDYDLKRITREFREGGAKVRKALFYAGMGTDFFPDLFIEAWSTDPSFVKKLTKHIPASEIGQVLFEACGRCAPGIIHKGEKGQSTLSFPSEALNAFYRSLPAKKKKAALHFFGVS